MPRFIATSRVILALLEADLGQISRRDHPSSFRYRRYPTNTFATRCRGISLPRIGRRRFSETRADRERDRAMRSHARRRAMRDGSADTRRVASGVPQNARHVYRDRGRCGGGGEGGGERTVHRRAAGCARERPRERRRFPCRERGFASIRAGSALRSGPPRPAVHSASQACIV